MPDGRRRSREGWADSMESEPADLTAHVHRLPRGVRLAVVGLTGAVFLLLIAVGLIAVYVYQANQYVQGRGVFRDQENERTNQRINDAICDLLDQLPEGGLLDRPRHKYNCGPGIPLEQLTPNERQQLSGRVPPPTQAPATAAAPSTSSGTPAPTPPAPSRPAQPPATPPPAPTASPSPSQPPVLDLSPLTAPLCQSAVVCF